MQACRNLYLVKTEGLGTHYVVAEDPTQAYEALRREWDEKDCGFEAQRRLVSIEQLAEETFYPDGPHRLVIAQ